MLRECIDCEWCQGFEDSEGNYILFCMDTNGGNYLGETGILGFCEIEGEEDEERFD